jgi:hypothetical protein
MLAELALETGREVVATFCCLTLAIAYTRPETKPIAIA